MLKYFVASVVLLVVSYLISTFFELSVYIQDVKIPFLYVMTSCVEWKSSVIGMYFVILAVNVVLPVFWTIMFDFKNVDIGLGHVFGSFALFVYGWALLLRGIPLESLDGIAILAAKIYCQFYIGSFLILFGICFSTALFTAYFFLVCKYFYTRKVKRS